MINLDKDKILEKWASALGIKNRNINISKSYFDGHIDVNSELTTSNISDTFDSISFPMVRRVMSTTLAGGGWTKSKKQQQKQDRLNKLRQIQGDSPNIVLEKDEYIQGLVSVVPMSAPSGQLFYVDFKYVDNKIEAKRKRRKEKLIKIDRINKIKYIEDVLSKK